MAIDLVVAGMLVVLGVGLRVADARFGGVVWGMFAYAAWYGAAGLVAWHTYRPVGRWLRRTWARIGDVVDRTSPWLMLACAFGCVGFLVSAPGAVRTVAARPGGGNAFASLFLAGVVGTLVGLVQLSPRHRDRAFRRLDAVGWLAPVLLVGSFLVCSVALFTFETMTGEGRFVGVADVSALPARQVAAFYVWHLLAALPLGDLPGTLKWREPLSYTGSDIGRLVVAFQVLTAATSVATVRAYWLYLHAVTPPATPPDKPSTGPPKPTPSTGSPRDQPTAAPPEPTPPAGSPAERPPTGPP